MGRRVLWVVTALYVLAVIAVGVLPVSLIGMGVDALAANGVVLPLGELAVPVIIGVAFFVLGILVATSFRRGARWLAFAVCLAIAAGIVFVQLFVRPEDIANAYQSFFGAAIGAAIGVLLVGIVSAIRARSRRPQLA